MDQAEATARGQGGGAATVAILNPLVDEIVQALLAMGGAAHRDSVIAYVARQRGLFRPPAELTQALAEAFAAYCGGAVDPRAPGLLHLPYGAESQRWALTDQAFGLLRESQARSADDREPRAR